ncbi:zinc finger protein 208-like isoform X2 [Lutzomyia longipalpis]|uniref:zinc finger protein 208-like isoform X2 n=1 Tax=Lutzomyia longipalpis TaxID=7200 RepID=UPI0024835CE1|nr:zinc finger protein 208-like isoform X2 [Lutzomyia longipalpis]
MEKNKQRAVPCMLPLNIRKDSVAGRGDGVKKEGIMPLENTVGDITVYGPHTSRDGTNIIVNSNTLSEISVSTIAARNLTITPTGTSKQSPKFPCSLCERAFESRDLLAIHMKTHPNEQNQAEKKDLPEIKVPQIKNITSLSLIKSQTPPTAAPVKSGGSTGCEKDDVTCPASAKEQGGQAEITVTPLENCMSTILSKVPAEVTISDCVEENATMRPNFPPPVPNLTLIPRENAAGTSQQMAKSSTTADQAAAAKGYQDQDVVNFNNGTNLQIIPQSVVGGVVELDELLKPYKCEMCDRAFRTQENLLTHKQQRHADTAAKQGLNIKYNCKQCRKSFTNRQEWRAHINSASHKQAKENPVDSDDDVLIIDDPAPPAPIKETAPVSSKSSHEIAAEKPFSCALCGRRFRSPENLKHHEFAHLKPQQPKEQTSTSFLATSPINQAAYQQSKSDVKGWKCPVCDTLIYKIDEYNTHMLLHYTNMPYKCRDCPEMFSTAIARDGHYQKIHANGMIGSLTPFVTLHKVLPEREAACDENEIQLIKLEELANTPMRFGEVRPFECLVCKKRFREKRVFDYHTQLHRGERPYGCRCGKYFRNIRNFQLHEQTHHKDDLSIIMQQIPNSISVIPHMRQVNAIGSNGMDLLVEGKRQLRLDEEDPAFMFAHSPGNDPEENLRCAMCDEEQPNRMILKQHELWHGRDGEFKCNICGKGFSSLVGIKIHKKKHLNDSLAEQAGIVEKTYDGIKESELFTEDEDSSDERRFSCRVCKKRFKSKQAIPYHMMTHTGETPFTCDTCHRGFRSLASLRLHQRRHNHEIHDGAMREDEEEIPMEVTPEIMLDSDEEMKPSVSELCSVVMMEPEVMIEEEEDSNPITPPKRPYISRKKPNDEIFLDGERFFICHLCPKKFKSRAALTYHSATHERINKCEECDKTFTSRMRLKKHYKSRHPGVKIPFSPISKAPDRSSTNYDSTDTADDDGDDEEVEKKPTVFCCDTCDRTFRSNESLVLHRKYNHSQQEAKQDDGEFVLGPEDPIAIPEVTLMVEEPKAEPHVASAANDVLQGDGEDPLKCRVCQKTLKSKAGFDYHMMIHTGEKPFECIYCGKFFRSYNYYKVHEQYHERNVMKRRGRPRVNDKICGVNLSDMNLDFTPNDRGYYECQICGKEFKSRQGLPYHMALHMKNRIFRCLQCNLSFRNLNRFQFHNLLTHTDGKDEAAAGGGGAGEGDGERRRGRPRKFDIFVKEEVDAGKTEEVAPPPPKGVGEEGQSQEVKEEGTVEAVGPPEDGGNVKKEDVDASSSSSKPKAFIKKLPNGPDGSLQFQCILCEKIFRSVQASAYHVMVHTGEKPFKCHVCNYGFRSHANLKKHQCGVFKPRPGRRSRYDTTGEFVGDVFQSQLVAWKALADMVKLKCRKCDQPFKSRPALMYHCMIHTGEKPYKCTICHKHFRSMTNLNLHQKSHEREAMMKRHLGEGLKLLELGGGKDGEGSNNGDALEGGEYKEFDGQEDGDYVQLDAIPTCTICNKTFRTIGYMRQHQRRAHRMRFQNDKTPPYPLEGEDEFDLPDVPLEFVDGGYKCRVCDKSFPTKGGYVYHSYTHSGARPYKCRRCPAQYRSRGNLKYHEKSVHKIHSYGNRKARRRRRHFRTEPGKAVQEDEKNSDSLLTNSNLKESDLGGD